jgi:hypothetical protein
MWRLVHYIIIDEYSMLSKSFLAKLSKHISITVSLNSDVDPSQSFGGLSIILCGDLHQFPPIVAKTGEALFYPINMAIDSTKCQLGRKIYEEFNTVVILKEQKRIKDQVWLSFLRRL